MPAHANTEPSRSSRAIDPQHRPGDRARSRPCTGGAGRAVAFWRVGRVLASTGLLMVGTWVRAAPSPPPASLSDADIASPALAAPAPILVFLTDFGVRDDAVAICKGVMLGIAPSLRIVDLTHDVTAFDIREGAFYLAQTAPYYPSGTVFVGVVDPGVGTERHAIVLETRGGRIFVAPDNGLLSMVAEEEGVAGIWQVTNPEFLLSAPSATFQGRDVFSPCGARLATGRSPSEVGQRLDQMIALDIQQAARDGDRLVGEVMLLDKAFGNVWTNIPRSLLTELVHLSQPQTGAPSSDPARLEVRFFAPGAEEAAPGGTNAPVPLVETFADVPAGAELAYFNSRDRLSLAVNRGSFAATHGVEAGTKVEIRIAQP